MVFKPNRPCGEPTCNKLTSTAYCEEHTRTDTDRDNSHKRGYTYQWRKYRLGFLRRNPLCKYCTTRGKTAPATEVDHIQPHRGSKELFWKPSNHQALCKSCHSRKTGRGL